jgi:hypothetical protein
MEKSIANLIARVRGLTIPVGAMAVAAIALLIGRQARRDRLKKQSVMMSETNLVYFKCPSCEEMSRLLTIKRFSQTPGFRYIETDCDTCHDTVRLRFVVPLGGAA